MQKGFADAVGYINNQIRQDPSTNLVIILENYENVSSYLTLKDRLPDADPVCIAAKPEVCAELDTNNARYISIDDYLSIEDIIKTGLENFPVVKEICNSMDTVLWKEFPFLEEYSLKPGRDNFQFMKILFDEISFRTKTIHNICKKESPSIVISFSKKTLPDPREYIPISQKENLFDTLLSQKTWSFNHISIHEDVLVQKEKTSKKISFIKPLINWMKQACPSIYNLFVINSRYGMHKTRGYAWIWLTTLLKRKKKICLVGDAYDWYHIIDTLLKNQYLVVYLDYTEKPARSPVIQENVLCTAEITALCTIDTLDFSSFFIQRSLPKLTVSLDNAGEYQHCVERFIRENHPCAFLYGTKSGFIDQVPAHVARKKNIPVISWQHGSSGFYSFNPILEYTELPGSDFHLVWGKGVQTKIIEELHPAGCTVIPTGSVGLEELFLKKPGITRYKILYVSTNYYYNSLYMGYSHKLLDNSLWISQKKIIAALGRCPEDTAVKIHPGTAIDVHFFNFITCNGFQRISVIRDQSTFPALAAASEIIVIDFPSTTLLQALASTKTLFVLLKYLTLTKNSRDLLMKRAFCSENADELADMITSYLQGLPLDQHPDVTNTEFLEEYGIVRGDGNVSGRVIDVINTVCRNGRQETDDGCQNTT